MDIIEICARRAKIRLGLLGLRLDKSYCLLTGSRRTLSWLVSLMIPQKNACVLGFSACGQGRVCDIWWSLWLWEYRIYVCLTCLTEWRECDKLGRVGGWKTELTKEAKITLTQKRENEELRPNF